MKISESSVLHGSPEQVWAAITDPTVLATVIPGCDLLTPIEPHRFALTITLGVASIKGSYSGEITLTDLVPPASLTMRANGIGAPGTIDTSVAVTLTPLPGAATRVDYDADAVVGGMVGGVGQRVLAGVARRTAGLFFAAVDDVLTGSRPVQPAGLPATVPAIGPAAPAAAPLPPARPSVTSLIGAAAVGALSALAGVLVGAGIARRRG